MLGRTQLVTMASHYAVLGAAADASVEELRRCFHSASRRHHPDLAAQRTGSGAAAGAGEAADEAGAAAMQRINEAWRVLSDEALRRLYDAQLAGAVAGFWRSAGWGGRRREGEEREKERGEEIEALAMWRAHEGGKRCKALQCIIERYRASQARASPQGRKRQQSREPLKEEKRPARPPPRSAAEAGTALMPARPAPPPHARDT